MSEAEKSPILSDLEKKEDNSSTLKSLSNVILAKYSSIWIWSIIVGINSALTYSFYNYRQSNWLTLGIILSIFYGLAFLFCLSAWVHLATFLKKIIIPLIEESFDNSPVNFRDKAKVSHFQFLNQAFLFLIYALSCRFFAFILELIFSSLK